MEARCNVWKPHNHSPALSPVQHLSVSQLHWRLNRGLITDVPETLDGRELVAIGCQEGVWIGLRSDPKCMYCNGFRVSISGIDLLQALRKVLHLRAVTQCAVLESFSLFLVLSSKVGFTLHAQQESS